MATKLQSPKSLRVPEFGLSEGFGVTRARSGGIRWSRDMEFMRSNIKSLEKGTLENIEGRMRLLGRQIVDQAQKNAEWESHPGRHRGKGATESFHRQGEAGRERSRFADAHGRWPSNRTAKENLFAYVTRRGSFIELGLAHARATTYIRSDGSEFNYGVVLETGFNGKFAIIEPTLRDFHDDVLTACSNQLATADKAKRPPTAGGQNVHPGWRTGRDK